MTTADDDATDGAAEDDEERVREILREVIDPELGLDIVALGLVVAVRRIEGTLEVDLATTTPTCPMGRHLADSAQKALRARPGLAGARVRLLGDFPWTPDRLSDAARRALGW